jgi:hypothetical protein
VVQAPLGIYILVPKCSLNLFEAPALAQMLTRLNGVEYFRLTKRGVLRSAHESKQHRSSSSSYGRLDALVCAMSYSCTCPIATMWL